MPPIWWREGEGGGKGEGEGRERGREERGRDIYRKPSIVKATVS